jgi:hypothetical protein
MRSRQRAKNIRVSNVNIRKARTTNSSHDHAIEENPTWLSGERRFEVGHRPRVPHWAMKRLNVPFVSKTSMHAARWEPTPAPLIIRQGGSTGT